MRYASLPYTCIAAILICVACSTAPDRHIIGSWERINHDGDPSTMIFHENGTAEMLLGDVVLDRLLGGKPIVWRMDTAQNPIHLDFVLNRPGSPETIPMLVRFITPEKIQLQISRDMKTRPSAFFPETSRDSIVLVKKR
jgi:hypothetical protein